jgi:hypothetical protein
LHLFKRINILFLKPNDANNEEQQKQHQEKEQRIASQYNTKVFACDVKISFPTANALLRIAQFKVSLLTRYFLFWSSFQ